MTSIVVVIALLILIVIATVWYTLKKK
jgi:hypothetical protein